MSALYWCCREDGPDGLLGLLAARGWKGRAAGLGNRQPVIVIPEPDAEILRETALLLARGQLRSAALVASPLAPDELYIAAEWWDRLVVEKAELAREDLGEWFVPEREYAPRGLVIYKVRERRQLEEPEGIEQGAAVDEPIAEVINHPGAYYGEFADPMIGGANALFAAGVEAASERGLSDNRVLVGPPETFGFTVDREDSSVVARRRDGVIAAEAVGFSLGSWEEALRLLKSHSATVDMAKLEGEARQWTEAGFSFGLAIVLIGLADPPVVIPTGSVYQQPSMGSRMQNLAVAQPANVTVAAGATVPLVLPAYCLNRTFSPPAGSMGPTPLVMSVSGSQRAVWDSIRRRYRGYP